MKTMFFVLVLSFVSAPAMAKTYKYRCYSYDWNGDSTERGEMSLTVSKTKATADIKSVSWDQGLGGPLDRSYKSRGPVRYLKFGDELILEEVLVDGGKTLREGDLGGFARVEGEAEGGFYQYKFICRR